MIASAAIPRSHRLAVLLMIGAVLGKATGLIRELLLARTFGTTPVADSFRGSVSAMLIPIAPLQNEGVPGVLVPLYREWSADGSAPKNFGALTLGLLVVSLAIMGLTLALVHPWIALLLGGLDAETQATAVLFTQIMTLGMPGSVVLNCLAAAEIATGNSRVTGMRPTILNAAVIAAIVGYLATGHLALLPLSYCVALNGLAIWVGIALCREKVLSVHGIGLGCIIYALRVFFVRLKPFLVLPVFDQLQVLIERRVSSSLQGGAIATVDYARTLTDTAVLLVSQPLGLALLHKGSSEDARAQMDIVTRRMLAVTLPAALFLMVFAPDIVRLLFARGAFTSADVETTTQAVRGISAGLWASVIAWILIRILNNMGRNGEAIRILCVGYGINAGLNVAALMVPASLGLLVIGLGEAARGLFLLVAIAIALGGLRLLLSALGRSLPITAVLAALLVMLNLGVDSTLLRLSGGVLLTAAASAGLLHILDRDQLRKVIAMIKARLSASGAPS